MKGIEIELENDGTLQEIIVSRARNFSNILGRKIAFKRSSRYWSFGEVKYVGKEGVRIRYSRRLRELCNGNFREEDLIPYENIQRAVLLNPEIGDDMKTRAGYTPVTERTIAETVKWAQRGYRA